jgi:hypothetical protein
MYFPDSSKLLSRQIDLSWNTISLYRLLLRRLANTGAIEMIEYMQQIPELILEDPTLGYVPTESKEKIKEFVDLFIGQYMGTSPKKGESYLWTPNHLQDAKGELAPRSFLKCYSFAAQTMLKSGNEKLLAQLEKTYLLTPSSIQGAVQEVSQDRVEELKEDFPWLSELKEVLTGETLLMSETDFKVRLKQLIDRANPEMLPANTVEGMERILQELGIVSKSSDGRINMPEIYLHGFGLKRKGGLRRSM